MNREQVQKQLDMVEQASAATGQDYKFQTNIEILEVDNTKVRNQQLERLKKLKADNTKVQFVLCDQISTAAFSERYKKLNAFTGSLVTCAETVKIRNREDLNYYQSRCLLLGYPGVNLRHSAEGYKSNDSVSFLAVHTPKTKSYNVVDVKSGRGEFAGFAIAVCATDQGDEFEVMCPQHVVTSIELTTNLRKYISRRLTVAYFDLTFGDDIVPKYPVAVAFK